MGGTITTTTITVFVCEWSWRRSHHDHHHYSYLCVCVFREGTTTTTATTIFVWAVGRHHQQHCYTISVSGWWCHNLCGGREAPPPPPHYYLCVWVVVGAPPPIRSVSFKGLTTTISNTSVSLDTFTSTIHLYFTSIAHLHKDNTTTHG